MAIELDTTRVAAQTVATANRNNAPATQETKTAPLLGGENVEVSSGAKTDLEKLVAQLKLETDDTKMNVAQQRISVLNTVLDSMSDRITEKEKATLVEIEELNGEKSEAESELSGLESDKTSSEGRIAELDLLIESLEKQIEQAVEDGEDHREQVEELKEQREEEQEKLDSINNAIESANARIAGIDSSIAELSKTIAQTTLNEVANALRIAANEKTSSSSSADNSSEMSNADRVKEDKKEAATDIGNVIRESLDKIDEQMRRTLEESQPVKA